MIEPMTPTESPELLAAVPGRTGDALDDLQPEMQERLAAVLDEYLEELERGDCRDAEELIAMNPDLAGPLRRYLGSLNLLHQATSACHPKTEPQPPGQLGDFQILSEIGRGGMGIVYQARQVSLGRLVALKVLPFAAVLDRKQVARFQNEAQAAAQLHHPNIVPVYAVGCERGVHYYSMQLIDGQSLDRAMTELRTAQAVVSTVNLDVASIRGANSTAAGEATARGFSTQKSIRSRNYVRSVVELVINAAEALNYAHECGVVHRDVKPSNLLIDRHGKLWVTDFGLARCQNVSNITATGDFFGTLRYMSPEHASGRMALVDHRSDIYSLGVTLFEMLTLRAPFEANDRATLLRMIADSEAPSPRKLNAAIPNDLETILLKTLSKSRDERYSTASELAADLRRFLAGEPTHARRPTLLDRAGKWVARHSKLVAAGICASVLAVATVATAAVLLARQQAQTHQALQQAELHLRVAREMVDELGPRLVEDLAGIPETESVQLRALEKAERFYRDFLEYAANQPRWQRDVATASFKRGAILERLGRHKEAVVCYEEAGGRFASLAISNPDDPNLACDLALCENNLGLIAIAEQSGEGLRRIRKAESVLDALATKFPNEERIQADACLVRLNLGVELNKAGQDEQAILFLDSSISIARELLSRSPDHPTAKRRLAIGLDNLSGLTRREDASQLQLEAIQLHRDLIAREPKRAEHSSGLAAALDHLGSLRMESGNLESAVALFEESLAIRRHLADRFPSIAAFQTDLAAALNNLGMARLNTDLAVAKDLFEESLVMLRDLVQRFPRDVLIRSELAGAINNRGLLLQRQGNVGEAVSAFHEAIAVQKLVLNQLDVPKNRDQLERFNSNLQHVLQFETQHGAETHVGTIQDNATTEAPATSGNST